MGKAKHRKKTEYQTSMTKSVFLYGTPNRGKLNILSTAQDKAKELVNGYIPVIYCRGTPCRLDMGAVRKVIYCQKRIKKRNL